jgi:hypothetical protein
MLTVLLIPCFYMKENGVRMIFEYKTSTPHRVPDYAARMAHFTHGCPERLSVAENTLVLAALA